MRARELKANVAERVCLAVAACLKSPSRRAPQFVATIKTWLAVVAENAIPESLSTGSK